MSYTHTFSGSLHAQQSEVRVPTVRTGSLEPRRVTTFVVTIAVIDGSNAGWELRGRLGIGTITGTGSGTFSVSLSGSDVSSLTDQPSYQSWNWYANWRTTSSTANQIPTLTSLTCTVTTEALIGPPPPDPPPPIGPPPPTPAPLRFIEDLPHSIQYDTDYTVIFQAINSADQRHTYANGKVKLKLQESADIKTTGFLVNGTDPATTDLTFVEGYVSCVLRFPTGVAACVAGVNLYLHTVANTFTSGTTDMAVTYGPVASPESILASPGLKFTVQPPAFIDVGAQFVTPVQVSVVNGAGVVNTTWTGDIVLTMRNLSGVESTEFLIGGKTITPVSGVATFPGLYISKIGFYTLHATSTVGTLTLTGISTGVQIVGDDGESALRQNLRDDATIWVKTTGVSAPTFATFTTDNKSTLDGDEAVTANIVFDGTRWVFPYTLKATLVRFKVKLSTLASTPTIQLYSSQDTTTGQNGTWTLVTSMTPTTTGVFIAEFSFSSPVYAKGLWLTLNDGGGAATGTWYSQQVMGKYLGSVVTYLADDGGIEIPDEQYLSVPAPIETLGGARTVTRNIQIRNNTASEMNLALTPSPARSTGDTLVDGDNFIATDASGNLLSDGFTIPALATVPAILRYTITAADNDKSGNHYIRLSLASSLPQTNLSYLSANDSGTSIDTHRRNLATGASIAGIGNSNNTLKQQFYVPATNRLYRGTWDNPSTNIVMDRSTVTATSFAGNLFQFITTWTGGEEITVSGVGILNDRMLLSNSASTTIVKPNISISSQWGDSNILRSSCLTFTIPAQTTGEKYFNYAPDGLIGIQNGTAVNSVVYLIDSNGVVGATINPTTPFAGRGLRSFVWDAANAEFYLVSSVSAGSRIIARYTKAGVLIASVSVTTEATLEGDGVMIVPPHVYIMYGGEHMYRYDIQTMANATLVHTLTGVNILSPGFVQISF